MKLLRKVFWPSAIALTVLVAMGAMGKGVTNVAAAPDIIAICGPDQIEVGETALYVFLTRDYTGPVVASIDNEDGDTDITSATQRGAYRNVSPTDLLDFVQAIGFVDDGDEDAGDAGELIDEFDDKFGFDYADCLATTALLDDLIDDLHEDIKDKIDDGDSVIGFGDEDIDCPDATPEDPPFCNISAEIIEAVAEALAKAVLSGEFDCDELSDLAENAAFNAGATEIIGAQFNDAIGDQCEDGEFPGVAHGIGAVDVTCKMAGDFDLSFVIRDLPAGSQAAQIEVNCIGDVFTADIAARPTTLEINPAIANVSHSLITVQLWDKDGHPASPGSRVLFTVNRCSIETSGVANEADYLAAAGLFGLLNPLAPVTALAVESSAAASANVDSATRQADEATSFSIRAGLTVPETGADRERTIAAAIVGCNPIDFPGVTPGPLTVTAFVDRLAPLDDLILTTELVVVGPPAANGLTVTASPATLACGEKATIDITVRDAIGQNVSDHTFVEIVTNAGGVLAGTGAVAGGAGLVSPISSTVAETFSGKVTAFLLTSTAHVGAYEVVVTTGGGGGVTGQLGTTTNLLGGLFTTAPISVQVTVTCTVPAAPVQVQVQVPTTTGPQTGQGIRPPSTGDAGLASTESNWVVGAVAAVVASLVVAGFAVKLARDEN